MKYRLSVHGFDSGLNELLKAVYYDWKRKTVHNNEKLKNDNLCIKAIRSSECFKKVVITQPIVIHYRFVCKDKKHDRMNIATAFDKSFQDALQKCSILKNDGWNDVINATFDFELNRNIKDKVRVDIVIEEIDSDEYRVFDWSIEDEFYRFDS